MKYSALFVLIIFLLVGCDSLPTAPSDEGSRSASVEVSMGDEQYYINIAKELYVAGQYKQAYQISLKLADKGNTEAQYLLGYLLYYGRGTVIDKKQGTKWIQISADSGYRPAIEAFTLIEHGMMPSDNCEFNNPSQKSPQNVESILITPTGQSTLTKEKR